MSRIKKLLTPEYIAGCLMLCFGIIFIIIIQPLNTPDEANHLIRAYQVSNGEIFISSMKPDGCVGEYGSVLKSPNLLASDIPRSVVNFTTLDRNHYSISQQLGVALNPSDTVSTCARQTQANSPVGYLPQAAAILITRIFHAPPIVMDYAARLAVLLVWIGCIVWAIKILPVRKWAVVGIALLPIAIQQSISIGVDALSIAPAVLFMAILLRSYYQDRIGHLRTDFMMLAMLATVAALSKPIMILLVLLPFFYKVPKRRSNADKYSVMWLKLLAAAVPFVLFMVWNLSAAFHHAAASDVFPLAAEKNRYFSQSPLDGVLLFVDQAIAYIWGGLSLDQFGAFGWFSSSIPQTFRFLGITYLCLLLLTGYEQKKPAAMFKLSWYNAVVALLAVSVVAANIFTLFVIWTSLSAPAIDGVQFRYFLPSFFMLACLAHFHFSYTAEKKYRLLVLIGSTVFFIISVMTIVRAA